MRDPDPGEDRSPGWVERWLHTPRPPGWAPRHIRLWLDPANAPDWNDCPLLPNRTHHEELAFALACTELHKRTRHDKPIAKRDTVAQAKSLV